MPATDGRHHLTTHRACDSTLSAGAVIIALAAAACTATTEHPRHRTGHDRRCRRGPANAHRGGLHFRRAVLRPGVRQYHQQHPAVTVGYSAVGSSAGIAAISAKQADFGASDVPMTASEQAAAQGGPVVQVPVDLGAEGVVYHLSLPAGSRLHLTGPVSPASSSARSPPGTTPPSPPSTPASASRARPSPSSTAPTAAAPPTSSATTCPASTRPGRQRSAPARRSSGRSGRAQKATPGSAHRCTAPPTPSATSSRPTPKACSCPSRPSATRPGTTSSLHQRRRRRRPETRHHPDRLLHRQRARRHSYPICGYSWALVYTHQPSQATGQALVTLLDWLTHQGQAYAAATLYVPLPPGSGNSPAPCSSRSPGPDGTHLLG